MMVLFLTGLVSVILLRTVKRDFTRYDREEGLADFVSKTFIIHVKSNAFFFFFLFRIEIWATNTDGNRFMEMSFDNHHD